jgi:hypothetical protein
VSATAPSEPSPVRQPSLADAVIPLVALAILIGGSLALFGLDALDGPIQVALLMCALVAALIALTATRSPRAESERYSIPSGPREAPDRNWRTNMLSELNSSSAGPDSTMRPFHSTAMYSATRFADMMSWVITT